MYSAKLVYRKWINFIFGLTTSSDDVNLHLHNLLRFQATYFFRFLFETSCILEIIVIIRTCVSFYVKTGAYVGSLWSRRVDHSLKVSESSSVIFSIIHCALQGSYIPMLTVLSASALEMSQGRSLLLMALGYNRSTLKPCFVMAEIQVLAVLLFRLLWKHPLL